MAERTYFLARVIRASNFTSYLTVREVAYRCGIHPDLVDRFVKLGLIESAECEAQEALFSPDVIPVVRKILRLRNQLGVNYAGIGVILELMSRIESLESYIRELESKTFDGE